MISRGGPPRRAMPLWSSPALAVRSDKSTQRRGALRRSADPAPRWSATLCASVTASRDDAWVADLLAEDDRGPGQGRRDGRPVRRLALGGPGPRHGAASDHPAVGGVLGAPRPPLLEVEVERLVRGPPDRVLLGTGSSVVIGASTYPADVVLGTLVQRAITESNPPPFGARTPGAPAVGPCASPPPHTYGMPTCDRARVATAAAVGSQILCHSPRFLTCIFCGCLSVSPPRSVSYPCHILQPAGSSARVG